MRVTSNIAKRPSLSFLFFVAVIVWIVPAVIEFLMWQRYISDKEDIDISKFAIVLLLLIFFLLFTFVVVKKRAYLSIAYILVGAIVASSFVSILFWNSWEANIYQAAQNLNSQEFIFETTSDMSENDYGTNSQVRIYCNGKWVQARVLWPQDHDSVSIGHRFKACGTYVKANKEDSGRWNHKNGLIGTIKLKQLTEIGKAKNLSGLFSNFRDASFERIASISTETSGVLAGILLGNKTLYSGTEIEQEFKSSGLAHLMAVSGTHLAVVCALANFLLGMLSISRKLKLLCVSAFVISYLVITAMSLSALRSCIMCVVGLSSYIFKRRTNSLQALCICVIFLILLDPSVVFSAAFQLSVLAVLGILVFSPLVSTWLSFVFMGKFNKITEAISIGIAASLATSPVSIIYFQQLPLLSPISTCIAAPVVTLALGLGLVGLLFFPFLAIVGKLFLFLSSVCVSFILFLVKLFAGIPYSCIPLDSNGYFLSISFTAMLVLLWVIWPLPKANEDIDKIEKPYKKIKAKIFVLACFSIPIFIALISGFGIFNQNSTAKIVMLDVGQGDSMLICDSNSAILVDVGEHDKLLKAALARCGIRKLDAVVITHKDADHAGALSSLAGVVKVDNVFIHKDLINYEGETEVISSAKWLTGDKGVSGLVPGDKLHIGRFKLTMLAPEKGGESENEDSLVNILEYDEDGDGVSESSALLTGDAESQVLDDVCDVVKHVDIVKVPHHGSKKAFSDEQLSKLSPKIALISVGEDNRYGHPASNTLNSLKQCGARVYRTDINSDITISFSQSKLSVSLKNK